MHIVHRNAINREGEKIRAIAIAIELMASMRAIWNVAFSLLDGVFRLFSMKILDKPREHETSFDVNASQFPRDISKFMYE